MQAVLADCSSYPDDEASTLRRKFAEHHGVEVEQVLVAGGLTEFLGMVARTFLAPGLNAVTSGRSFIVYRLATQAANAQLIEVPTRQDGFDLEAIAATVNHNTQLFFSPIPTIPPAPSLRRDEVDHLLRPVPDQSSWCWTRPTTNLLMILQSAAE